MLLGEYIMKNKIRSITNQHLQMYHLQEFMSTSSLVYAALKYTTDFAFMKSNKPVLPNFYSHAF